mmetsp:Transcript_23151/g.74991  ORF Transcript_23151/g.74991 Transcript_23151/m.74991 type:complete len:283 (-) Transcript_23151:538-1386(-)
MSWLEGKPGPSLQTSKRTRAPEDTWATESRIVPDGGVSSAALHSSWSSTRSRMRPSMLHTVGPASCLQMISTPSCTLPLMRCSAEWHVARSERGFGMVSRNTPCSNRIASPASATSLLRSAIWVAESLISSPMLAMSFATAGSSFLPSSPILATARSSDCWTTWQGVATMCSVRETYASNSFWVSLASRSFASPRACLTRRPVSSRMKQRVWLKTFSPDSCILYATLLSMMSGTILPALLRKRTGTSLMALPEPRVLNISDTSSFSSGQNFMMGWPMYSSAV